MHSIPASSGQPFSEPDDGWGQVPEPDRLAWARLLIDYPPTPLGVMARPYVYSAVLRGVPRVPEPWRSLARELHALGFTPLDYYLLCQDLELRHLRGLLTAHDHGRLFEHLPSHPAGAPVPRAAAWATWVLHVRAGRSPRRAADYVLTGGDPAPLLVTSGGTRMGD